MRMRQRSARTIRKLVTARLAAMVVVLLSAFVAARLQGLGLFIGVDEHAAIREALEAIVEAIMVGIAITVVGRQTRPRPPTATDPGDAIEEDRTA